METKTETMTVGEWRNYSEYANECTGPNAWRAAVDFGFQDAKGRAIGCTVVVIQEIRTWDGYKAVDGDRRFRTYVQSTRDGRHYGSSQGVSHGDKGSETLAEAQAEAP